MLRFDDVLRVAAEVLERRLPERTSPVTLVRDLQGSLTVVLPDGAIEGGGWEPLAAELHTQLEQFSPGVKRVLLRESDLIEPDDILGSPDRIQLPDLRGVWLVDRLLTNQDWIRAPLRTQAPLPTATAFSIKGGVGRSTAFAMLAWHLARMGRKVLVVDLDLEAPGIAAMLLPELPDYGVVDWCVEALVGEADADLYDQMWLPAPLAEAEDGEIVVVPAFGQKTEDYVAKLGRAYAPVMGADGKLSGLADRLLALLVRASQHREPPDIVLLDARAGLSDLGSAAVAQLGAEVFLFGRDDAQSWDAYDRLFAHLRMSRGVRWGMPREDLRWRLKMVAAQVEPTVHAREAWIDQSYSTWATFYDAEVSEDSQGALDVFTRDDAEAPHHPLSIAFDPRFRALDLVNPAKRPDWSFVESAFGGFLAGATARLFPVESPDLAEPEP